MKINDLVELTFLDHVFGADTLDPIKAWGKIHSISKDTIVLVVWDPIHLDLSTDIDDREFIAIARKTIKGVRILL